MHRVTGAARAAAQRVLARVARGARRDSGSPPRRRRSREPSRTRPETPPPPYSAAEPGTPAVLQPSSPGGAAATPTTSTPRPGLAWRQHRRRGTPGLSPVVGARTLPARLARPALSLLEEEGGLEGDEEDVTSLPAPITPSLVVRRGECLTARNNCVEFSVSDGENNSRAGGQDRNGKCELPSLDES